MCAGQNLSQPARIYRKTQSIAPPDPDLPGDGTVMDDCGTARPGYPVEFVQLLGDVCDLDVDKHVEIPDPVDGPIGES